MSDQHTTTDAERYAPITIDPYEHAQRFADAAASGGTREGAVRVAISNTSRDAIDNAARLRQAASLLRAAMGADDSGHAQVGGQLQEVHRTIEAAAEWYDDYGEALQVLATERRPDVRDA